MTPEQCRAARGWLLLSQNELAQAAEVGVSTVRDFETGKRVPIRSTLVAIRTALEERGIRFHFVGEFASGISINDPENALSLFRRNGDSDRNKEHRSRES